MSGDILSRMLSRRDEKYGDFTASLIPAADRERVIGVRLPELRRLAGELVREGSAEAFLRELPHAYLEENLLHSILLSGERDLSRLYAGLDRFLPYVDNWSVCDALRPKEFRRHPADLPARIDTWLASEHSYTVRFAIGMLMHFYLDEAFDPAFPERVAAVRSEDYYVRMMAAWYFATALAKRYEEVLPYLSEYRLDVRTHNKTIQKALESVRVTPEHKEVLRSLRVKA